MSVAQLLRDAASAHPHSTAIDGDGRRVSFAELDATANRVAHALIRAGVEPGDRVGFIDRNGTEYWEVFLGALKAGAVLVPLNFRLGATEAAGLLADAGVSLVVAGPEFAPPPGPGPTILLGQSYLDWLDGPGDGDPGRDAQGAQLVELIYSSGTTGVPKGVLVGADQLVWSVRAFGAALAEADGQATSRPCASSCTAARPSPSRC